MTDLTTHERFLLIAHTRRYPNPLARRVAIALAAMAWQEAPDCRSALVDVDHAGYATRCDLPPVLAGMGMLSLTLRGIAVRTGPDTVIEGDAGAPTVRLTPMRLDLDQLPDCSSVSEGIYPLPPWWPDTGQRQIESQWFGLGGDQ